MCDLVHEVTVKSFGVTRGICSGETIYHLLHRCKLEKNSKRTTRLTTRRYFLSSCLYLPLPLQAGSQWEQFKNHFHSPFLHSALQLEGPNFKDFPPSIFSQATRMLSPPGPVSIGVRSMQLTFFSKHMPPECAMSNPLAPDWAFKISKAG